MEHEKNVRTGAELLRAADNILILTHRRPDGDTTGSAGALCRALRDIGKTAYIRENPDITNRYAPLIVPFSEPTDFKPQFIVTTDIADIGLFTDNAVLLKDAIDLVIDHHRSNSGFGKFNIIMPERAACGEIVYEIIKEMGIALTKDIANSLYIAISTDTGCFRYSNTTSHTHIVAAACLDAGVDGGDLNRLLFETKSRARFEMERLVFDSIEFYEDTKIAFVIITREFIEKTGADLDDLDSIAALTRQIEGVEVGITLTENSNGTVKASVRTKKEVDASKICSLVGGGGHLRAAGATFDCDSSEAKKRILEAVRTVYDEL